MIVMIIKEEITNDRQLLEDCILHAASSLSIEIPNIIQVARNLPLDRQDFEFYSDATCIEFHLLLLELLERFREALAKLSALSLARGTDLKQKEKELLTTFEQELTHGCLYGYALMRIARGRAFRMHMENIEPLLVNMKALKPSSAPNVAIGEQEDEDKNEASIPDLEFKVAIGEQEGEDEDEEIEEIQPGSLSKSFEAWLRLMVVHLDAIETLVNFVNGSKFPYETISIKILVAPTTSPIALPWSELFTDPRLFPIKDALNPRISTTNTEISQFLETAIDDAQFLHETHTFATKALASWRKNELKGVRQHLASMIDIEKSSDRNEFLKKSREMFKSGFPTSIFSETDLDKRMTEICERYPKPPISIQFYRDLNNTKFSGTLHCEAYLASLLDNFTQHFEIDSKYVESKTLQEMKVDHPLPFFFVIGFSLCCVYRDMDE